MSHAVAHSRPASEVREAIDKLKGEYENLVDKHEEYAKHIEEDEAYEKEEEWFTNCQETFMRLEVDTKMFIESLEKSVLSDLDGNQDLSKGKQSAPISVMSVAHQNEGIPSMQSETPLGSKDPHSPGMTYSHSDNQALPASDHGYAEQSTSKADNKQINAVNDVNNTALTDSTEQNTTPAGCLHIQA